MATSERGATIQLVRLNRGMRRGPSFNATAQAAVLALMTALLLTGLAAGSPQARALTAGVGVRAVGLQPDVTRARGSVTGGPAAAVPFAAGKRVVAAGIRPHPERLLVRFRSDVSPTEAARARTSAGATLVRSYQLVPGLELVRISPGQGGVEAAAALSRDPAVRYAVPDLVATIQALPDDPLYGQQWGPASIGAPEAWGFSTGSRSVIVAILDTGITLNHPDLEGDIWTNPNPGQGGYTGDVHGWNFVANNNNPADDYGHGTHVAGIIGAVGNNGLGVTGVNWSVSLMPLKICNSGGECSLSDEIAALEYAVAHGAKVANASFGGYYGGYLPEKEAIAAAGKQGLLYVAAAGNHASSDDLTPFFPASYSLENELSVAATTSSDTLASFSNYGFNSVDLGAPGEGILSTLPTTGPLSSSTGYGELSGTSMAAPQVSGAAALLMSENPDWTMQQVRARLIATAQPRLSLIGRGRQLRGARRWRRQQPDDRRTGIGLHRPERNGRGRDHLRTRRYRLRHELLSEIHARHTGHAHRRTGGRVTLRPMGRGVHRHRLVQRLAGARNRRHRNVQRHIRLTWLGRPAARTTHWPGTLTSPVDSRTLVLQPLDLRSRHGSRQDDLPRGRRMPLRLDQNRRGVD